MDINQYKKEVVDMSPQPLFDKLWDYHKPTAEHCLRVSYICYILSADIARFSLKDRLNVAEAALLHDIGKLNQPHTVLGYSSEALFNAKVNADRVAEHVEDGQKLYLQYNRKTASTTVASMILMHHELLDGSGYPLKMTGSRMLKPVQLLSVVNFWDNKKMLKKDSDLIYGYLREHNQKYNESIARLLYNKRKQFDYLYN